MVTKALAFAPVELTSVGQDAELCATNFGDGSVTVMMVIRDAANPTTVLAHNTPTIAGGATMCLSYSNNSRAAGDPTAVEISALIGLLRAPGAAANNLVSSLAVQDSSSQANRVVLAPLLLPAVRLPDVIN